MLIPMAQSSNAMESALQASATPMNRSEKSYRAACRERSA